MRSWEVKTIGYVVATLVPLTTFALARVGMEWLIPVVVFVLLPLMRPLLGNDEVSAVEAPLHSTWYIRFMEFLPVVSLFTLTTCLIGIAPLAFEASWPRLGVLLLAVITTTALTTAAMHELVHGRATWQRVSGRIIAGVVGYPHFPEEHLLHHRAVPARKGEASAAAVTNVFAYAAKQARHNLRAVWSREVRLGKCTGRRWIVFGAFVNACVGVLMLSSAGIAGLIFYLTASFITWFVVQAVNYIQHYGLPPTGHSIGLPVAWDDDCWVQACLTFNLSYHETHHSQMSRPYFLLEAKPARAPLPSSLGVMLVLSLMPAVFHHVMRRRLAAIHDGPISSSTRQRLSRCL